MKEEIKVSVLPGDQQTEVTLRSGEAFKLKEPQIIVLSGDIDTVKNFIDKRKYSVLVSDTDVAKRTTIQSQEEKVLCNLQTVHPELSIIEVDKSKMTITLLVDPQFPWGATVTGKLEESDELKPFCINKQKEFEKDALVKLLRFNRRFFKDPKKHASLLKSYQIFNAKAYLELIAESDQRGNSNNALKKTVTTDLPAEFTLTMPIFKGQNEETFRVEICLDVTQGGARFWFESVELDEIMNLRLESIFKTQLESFGDFVIVNK